MNADLEKAILLFERRRYREAEEALHGAIAQDPENGFTHALLAITISQQERHGEALEVANHALGLAPNDPYSFFTRALVLKNMDKPGEARQAILKAIGMDPRDVRYYRVLSQTYMAEDQWDEALNAAEEGLSIDPLNVECTNLRAVALVRLGRKGEAGDTITSALERDPTNPYTHANQGWTLLHQNKPKQAMEHFGQALRLNPNLEWAQAGIVEAMKARNIIYRVMLSYFLWMSRLSPRAKWGVILGAYFGIRFVNTLSSGSPELTPYLQPLIYLYLAFVYLSWTSPTLFDLLLRFNKFGRLALPHRKIVASNWVAVCLCVGFVCLITAFLIPNPPMSPSLLSLALASVLLVMPVSSTFSLSNERHIQISTIYTGLLAIFAVLDFSMRLFAGESTIFSALFLLGLVAYLWISNIFLK